jgi:hypothetical protein
MSFYTDVIVKDARFNTTARVSDVNLLEPVTRAAVEAIISDAKALGIDLIAFETYRSQARQQQLFDQGASKLRAVGVHHYGLACDLVKMIGGEPSWKGDFSFLGQFARHHGLVWGGDWGSPGTPHSFIDAVHVQRCAVALQPALFSGNWYPDGNYDPFGARPLEAAV